MACATFASAKVLGEGEGARAAADKEALDLVLGRCHEISDAFDLIRLYLWLRAPSGDQKRGLQLDEPALVERLADGADYFVPLSKAEQPIRRLAAGLPPPGIAVGLSLHALGPAENHDLRCPRSDVLKTNEVATYEIRRLIVEYEPQPSTIGENVDMSVPATPVSVQDSTAKYARLRLLMRHR
jgi:hypothetical protein